MFRVSWSLVPHFCLFLVFLAEVGWLTFLLSFFDVALARLLTLEVKSS
jgi:TRAP-type uncharacterized transport system fused permease subunit